MIIFRPSPTTDIDSILNQINSAISDGIGWIQLPTHNIDERQAGEMAEAVIPICRENDVILTLENNVDTVNRLHNHGVHLMSGSMHPAFIREKLGPHAIIGLQIGADFDPSSLKNVDIDYLTLDENINLDQAQTVAQRLTDASLELPLVITGQYTPDEVKARSISGILRKA